MLTARCVDWSRHAQRCLAIRQQVFVNEQGIDPAIEFDGRDPHCLHVLASDGQTDVGTARMLPDNHIGRVAVLATWRDRGIGRLLMHTLCEEARARGVAAVHLASQESAIGFYRQLGFTGHGELYLEASIPHLDMTLTLQAP